MPFLNPDPDAMAQMNQTDMSKPVGMLNMLKFKAQAQYGSEHPEPPATGEEAYGRYSAGVAKIFSRTGAGVSLAGDLALIGPQGEWDRVFVVRYAERRMLFELFSDPEYQKISHHRQAALSDSRLFVLDWIDGVIAPGA